MLLKQFPTRGDPICVVTDGQMTLPGQWEISLQQSRPLLQVLEEIKDEHMAVSLKGRQMYLFLFHCAFDSWAISSLKVTHKA